MVADGMLRSARPSKSENDVIGGHWTIDPHRSSFAGPLATLTLKNVEGMVDVTPSELTINAVFDVEEAASSATFPAGTLRARTLLWSGEDGLAMGDISLEGMTR